MGGFKLLRIWAAAALLFPAILCGADKNIDTAKSVITIHVGKTGLFSGAGHEHWVDAPIAYGMLREGVGAKIEFAVDARTLRIRPDQENEGDQAKVQETMERDVLETGKYPQILFHSTQVTANGRRSWSVTGTLELHGVSKTVAAEVWREGEIYTGSTRIRQKDFGIKPVSAGGGLVKVKDELNISFKVYAK
ncbi:MAG TPA: YceI family protein [Terriglobia bacterium]|nr:YceI family protein [Terriglobia bacterium]